MLTQQVNLLRPSISADTWGRYYTSNCISQHLVDAIRVRAPKVIVELGAGRGALIGAAAEKWQRARLVTVDMDSEATPDFSRLMHTTQRVHEHFIHDVLDDDLASHVGLALNSVDVAICNPPYVRPRWRQRFGHILEDAGLSGALQSVHDAGADLLFIAQNLRLLRRHGKLGLILPDGLITAEKFAGVRKTLLLQHQVELVVQLPRRVFARTEAQTHLVVLAKRAGETQEVALRRLSQDGCLSDPVFVTAEQAKRRLDFDYHLTTANRRSSVSRSATKCVRDLVKSILRGSFGSQQIAGAGFPIFHLTDFGIPGAAVPRRFRLTRDQLVALPQGARVAKAGDLLVGRIGRNLPEKIAVVNDGACVVSDCVFIIRLNAESLVTMLAFLTSPFGQRSLASSAHGVGARYLSTADVLELQLAP